MKKMMTMIVLLLITGLANAQLRKVPSEVTDALKTKYPNAQQVEWKDKLTHFDAEFVDNNVKTTASFSNDGTWKETDQEIDFEKLPAAVKDGFSKSKFNDWTTGSVTKIISPEGVQYKIYAEKSSIIQKKFLYFNEKGQLVKDTPGI